MARRTAKKLEPIQYDELLNNSSMEGLVSFINYRPEATSSTLVESAATDISSTVGEASADVAASPGPADIMLSYSTPSELPSLADAPLSSTVDIPSADDEGASATDGSTVDVNGSIRHHSAVDLAPTVDDTSSADEASAIGRLDRLGESSSIASAPVRGTVDISSTVSLPAQQYTSFVRNRQAGDVSSTVDPKKIVLLNQGRPPKEISAFWVSLSSGQSYEARKVQWVSIAQHSMTVGQERFYEAIWKAKSDHRFHIDAISRHQKKFRCGYDILARITRIADRNVQKNIPQLISKRVLHSYGDFDSSTRRGTTYDIFSYEEILRRQRAAGLCYIVKNGPGVEFAVPEGWTADASPTGDDSSSDLVSSTVDATCTDTVNKTSTMTVDAGSTPINTFIFDELAPPGLHKTLNALVPGLSAEAAERIWRESREVVPDIQPEEIAFWFEQRARMIYQNRRLINPLGLLLSSIKDWLTERKVLARRNHLRELAEDEQRVRKQLEGGQPGRGFE